MNIRHHFAALIIAAMCMIACALPSRAQYGTKDYPYLMEIFWKKKGGKMAVFCKSKLSKEYQITDYLFDPDCKESFGKGKKLAFIGDCCFSYSPMAEGKCFINNTYGAVIVKVNGLYGIISITASHDPRFCEWRMVFEPQFATVETVGAKFTDIDKFLEHHAAWLMVTKPGSDKKGLLNITPHTARAQNSIEKATLLECEYDEILRADYGLIDEKEGIMVNARVFEPTFIFRKGDRWGAVSNGTYVIPARYDLKSFTRGGQYKGGERLSTPYLVRGSHSECLVERGDSLFLANCYGADTPLPTPAGDLPKYRVEQIRAYEGQYTGEPISLYGNEDDLTAYSTHRSLFIPNRGNIRAVRPWRVFASDSTSAYLLDCASGMSLYNAVTGRDLVTDADTIALATDGFFTVKRGGGSVPKKAFVTRDYAEAVTFEDYSELPLLARTARTVGSTHILDYKGSTGLYDEASGFALPCYFDSIVPIADVVDSIPEAVGRLFLTYKNKKIGIAGSSASVMGMAFDKISRSPDGRGVVLKGKIYNSSDPYTLWITSDDGASLTFDDNLNPLIYDLISWGTAKAKKDSPHYPATTKYLLCGMFEFAANIGRGDLLPRIHDAGACIAINTAVCIKDKRYAMEWLDRADAHHARAVALSDKEISDLDLPGIRERMLDYFRQQETARAEAEAARQREAELQAQAQARAAELQRQQRAESWALLANTLADLSQNINAAVTAATPAPRHSASRTTVHPTSRQASATQSPASATPTAKRKTPRAGDRSMLEQAYEIAKGDVMKYYYGRYEWNLKEVRQRQQSMRDARAAAQRQGFTIYKSDFEDVSEPYRK